MADVISHVAGESKVDRFVMVCGRPGMTAFVAGPKSKDFKSQAEVKGVLGKLGYNNENVWKV